MTTRRATSTNDTSTPLGIATTSANFAAAAASLVLPDANRAPTASPAWRSNPTRHRTTRSAGTSPTSAWATTSPAPTPAWRASHAAASAQTSGAAVATAATSRGIRSRALSGVIRAWLRWGRPASHASKLAAVTSRRNSVTPGSPTQGCSAPTASTQSASTGAASGPTHSRKISTHRPVGTACVSATFRATGETRLRTSWRPAPRTATAVTAHRRASARRSSQVSRFSASTLIRSTRDAWSSCCAAASTAPSVASDPGTTTCTTTSDHRSLPPLLTAGRIAVLKLAAAQGSKARTASPYTCSAVSPASSGPSLHHSAASSGFPWHSPCRMVLRSQDTLAAARASATSAGGLVASILARASAACRVSRSPSLMYGVSASMNSLPTRPPNTGASFPTHSAAACLTAAVALRLGTSTSTGLPRVPAGTSTPRALRATQLSQYTPTCWGEGGNRELATKSSVAMRRDVPFLSASSCGTAESILGTVACNGADSPPDTAEDNRGHIALSSATACHAPGTNAVKASSASPARSRRILSFSPKAFSIRIRGAFGASRSSSSPSTCATPLRAVQALASASSAVDRTPIRAVPPKQPHTVPRRAVGGSRAVNSESLLGALEDKMATDSANAPRAAETARSYRRSRSVTSTSPLLPENSSSSDNSSWLSKVRISVAISPAQNATATWTFPFGNASCRAVRAAAAVDGSWSNAPQSQTGSNCFN
mmetsp:Transcript_75098/g.200407  ORF Transcript_75098/g.200407 Transcript_75098/m.200407 type:complete len:713 (-) Transcript_75098:456-2594(-)